MGLICQWHSSSFNVPPPTCAPTPHVFPLLLARRPWLPRTCRQMTLTLLLVASFQTHLSNVQFFLGLVVGVQMFVDELINQKYYSGYHYYRTGHTSVHESCQIRHVSFNVGL